MIKRKENCKAMKISRLYILKHNGSSQSLEQQTNFPNQTGQLIAHFNMPSVSE